MSDMVVKNSSSVVEREKMKLLIEYVSNKKSERVGCLVGTKYNEQKEVVPFKKQMAVTIAANRLIKKIKRDNELSSLIDGLKSVNGVSKIDIEQEVVNRNFSYRIWEKLETFMDRCERYFKVSEIVVA